MPSRQKNLRNRQQSPVPSVESISSGGLSRESESVESALSSLSSSCHAKSDNEAVMTSTVLGSSVPAFSSPPSGFRSAKELHNQSIYCVAWSSDLYEEDISANKGNVDNHIATSNVGAGSAGAVPAQEAENADIFKNESLPKVDKSNSEETSTSKVRVDSCKHQKQHKRLSSYLATCSGNHVALYEVEASASAGISSSSRFMACNSVGGTNATQNNSLNPYSSSASGGLVLRQSHRDADDDEIFFR
mmetsp:Transcript_6140/g.9147  ORF Transcript_6140/g.9147 Transcript_6140/m.9147 type:complete len:246 (+) Transcript_6140:144-881(+)